MAIHALQERVVDPVFQLQLVVFLAASREVDDPAVTGIDQKCEDARAALADFDQIEMAAEIRPGLHAVLDLRPEMGDGHFREDGLAFRNVFVG